MGGSVLIGIRRRNGEVYLAERWTNPTPYWFNDPDFYAEDEAAVQEYIDAAPNNERAKQDRIHPSEYGVILVDLINRRVLSRQDYTGIGAVHLYFTDMEKIELVEKLLKAGLITEVSADPMSDRVTSWGERQEGSIDIVLDEPRKLRFLNQIQKISTEVDTWLASKDTSVDHPTSDLEDDLRLVSFTIKWEMPGLEVSDIEGGRGYCHWPDVLEWVAQNGWQIPIMPLEEVVQIRDQPCI